MKFGIIINRSMIERGSSEPYRKVYDYLNEMEDLGFEMGWCGQHRFSSSTAFGGDIATEPSAPLAMLSALLARTRTMKMSTNIMLLPAHHPLEIAEQINTINEMSNNRFILGAGIGYKPDEFEHVGWGFKNRASRFEECLQILRMALTGKEFSYAGKHFKIDKCTVVPPPLHGYRPPLWIGAVSEPAMLRAGRLGDGWLISFAEHLVELQDKVARYKAIATEHGRPSTLCLMRDLHIAPTTRSGSIPNWSPTSSRSGRAYGRSGLEGGSRSAVERGHVRRQVGDARRVRAKPRDRRHAG